jgi:hypothetical protein
MEPVRDELDERVIRAGEPAREAVDRVVAAAFAGPSADATDRRSWPVALGWASACLVAVVSVGAWWWHREAQPPAGVYRVEIVSSPVPSVPMLPTGVDRAPGGTAAPGVFRGEAVRTAAPSPVIGMHTERGTTLILTTDIADDPLPHGADVIVGAGEQR